MEVQRRASSPLDAAALLCLRRAIGCCGPRRAGRCAVFGCVLTSDECAAKIVNVRVTVYVTVLIRFLYDGDASIKVPMAQLSEDTM